MQTQIDPLYHVTGFHKGQDFEAYHVRLAAALLDYQQRIDQGAERVSLERWDMEPESKYTRLRFYDREAGLNLDRPVAA